MIIWENITKTFSSDLLAKPFTALDDVSFAIKPGSMTGYLGANGAGKTTSLKIALGFSKASKGEIKFSPLLGSNRKEALRKIGYLPERPYFYPHLTGHEFSDYMGLLSGMPRNQIHQRRKGLAEKLGIEYALSRTLKTYSKGMLQRLGFLVAVQHDPEFIVLDEPLSGLDPVGRKELKDMMNDFHHQGKTVFFSTHIVSDVEETCDDVIFLRKGKIQYSGGVHELLASTPSRVFRMSLQTTAAPVFKAPVIEVVKHSSSWLVKAEVSQRENLLAEALASGARILSVTSEGATLEQVFYGSNP